MGRLGAILLSLTLFPMCVLAHHPPISEAPGPQNQQQSSERIYKIGEDGVKPPRSTYAPDPEYTDHARRKKIQGTVVLACVITATGTTRDVQIIKSLEQGLDKQAVDAVRSWRFEPATRDGSPVPVEIKVEVSFSLSR